MNDEILIKKLGKNLDKELESINFSADYQNHAKQKLETFSIKIFNLKAVEANILKQTCLSLGFDAAVNRYAVNCKCDFSDAIVCATKLQLKNLAEKLKLQPFRLKTLSENLKNFLSEKKTYTISGQEFDFAKTYIMGILNVTPDSFSDGGKNFETETAVQNAVKMISDGAKIIDIGGESTRPTAQKITAQEETDRVLPVIKKIREQNKDIILSLDTIHPETAKTAIEAGVDILNNVEAPEVFEPIFDFLAEKQTPIVIMHSEGVPPKPVLQDYNGDIADKIFKFFAEKINYLKAKGLSNNLFILDVGIGFGKSINDQFELIKRADEFCNLEYPVLWGISRKSFMTKTFVGENPDELTQIFSQHLIMKNANILRTHNVEQLAKLQNCLSKIK